MSSNLDLLRVAAVLCVLFAHLHDNYTGTHTDLSWHFGQLGVLMFFVHTSLVLMQSLDRSNQSGAALFKEFYLHRFFRIYPLAIVCILLVYWLRDKTWTATELLSNLALTQNLTYSDYMVGVMWSLPLEVQMYLVLPFLFIWFRDKPLSWLIGLWLVSIPFAIVQPNVTGRLGIIEYIPCFLGGVIAWRMAGQKRLPGWLWPLALAATTIVWMASTRDHNMYFRWAFCLTLGLTIPHFKDIQWRPLNAVMKTIADHSYGIYLSHGFAQAFAFKTMSSQPEWMQWAVLVVLTTLLPVLAYRLVEQPMIRLGKSLSGRTLSSRHVEEPYGSTISLK